MPPTTTSSTCSTHPSKPSFLQGGTRPIRVCTLASDDTCAICLLSYTSTLSSDTTVIRITKCGHRFHQVCLIKWLDIPEMPNTCPLCRAILFLPCLPSPEDRSTGSHTYHPAATFAIKDGEEEEIEYFTTSQFERKTRPGSELEQRWMRGEAKIWIRVGMGFRGDTVVRGYWKYNVVV
ncbi:hypothetical protein BDW02DRAFT_59072 [Decorospora gaudefroyi]|uniref:Anaphase-promoting complex subunit 11 n=1 Tax=Decorospora gaudefroyi TaxID=184978 RepID=A0A6A5K2N1_9PLEO|nr:hypothetical protein BDW02DRAFT_59072 [Decorospora gaudefroyi]